MSEQFVTEQSQDGRSLSSPSRARLVAWRLFFESALALVDLVDAELERDAGIPLRWYDVLVQTEEEPDGVRMNDLADRILTSKSGLTQLVDRMEAAGLVHRVRPEHDRRVILVMQTEEGRQTMERARRHHRHSINEHFAQHLTDDDVESIERALQKVSAHVRPLRPGRIRR